MQASSRVLINTVAQYLRAILNIVLSLFATRIILKVLGVDDYGIYALVAGVVSILSFITNSLIITTQRYLSVAQGEKDIEKSKKIFNNSNIIHITIGVIIILTLEAISPLLFNGFLNIPESRLYAAKVLYHAIGIILFLTLITSPYRAVLISHENIVYISIIEIIDSILKLVIAYTLCYVSCDKLITYGILLIGIQLFNFLAFSIYAFAKYQECILPRASMLDKAHLKGLTSFAGWTMYNLICNLGRTQGISVLLNRYMGPAINTAYGLGFQISGAMGMISQSLLNAMNPQLMKAEGAGNRQKMLRIAEIESKFAFFLLSAFSLPCIFEMPSLLTLWLGEVPEHAVLFCRMVMLSALADTITVGLGPANQAIGKIRNYTLIIYTLKLLTLPVAIVLLKSGLGLISLAAAYVVIELITSVIRLPFLKHTAGLSIRHYTKVVFLKEAIPVAIMTASCLTIIYIVDMQYRFMLTFAISITLYFLAIYLFGLCPDEKEIFNRIIGKFIRKR